MEMTKKEKIIFEKYFNIYNEEYADGTSYYEFEAWTDGGVDMMFYLNEQENETITQQFENYIDNFDIDEEIDIYRQDSNYCNAFTIRQSLQDFENWVEWLKEILKELKGHKATITDELIQGNPLLIEQNLKIEIISQIQDIKGDNYENICDNIRNFADLVEILEDNINKDFIILKYNPMGKWYIEEVL